jgi:hypothetical protein
MLETKKSTAAAALLSLAAFGAASLPSAEADGAAIKNLTLYNDAKALSTDPMYQWSGAVNATTAPVYSNLTASCVAVAPTLVIGAGHFTPGLASQSVLNYVSFGANYNSPNALKLEIDHWEQFPGYSSSNLNSVDLGFYWLKHPIPGFTKHVTFGSISMGGTGTMVDYGNIGDPTTGERPSLGDRMAGYAPRITSNTSSYPASKYDFFDFNGGASLGIPLNVQGLNFSSGAPWYNANGDLTNLLIAKTNGIGIGESVSLKLYTSEVQAELVPRIDASWASVPEPSSFGLLAAASGAALLRRRRRS